MGLILIKDGRCLCGAADKCVKGRIASQYRCTKEEIEEEGFTTITIKGKLKIDSINKTIKK